MGEMALPDGTVILGIGKSSALAFSTTATWERVHVDRTLRKTRT
jgi:hypothetical protein